MVTRARDCNMDTNVMTVTEIEFTGCYITLPPTSFDSARSNPIVTKPPFTLNIYIYIFNVASRYSNYLKETLHGFYCFKLPKEISLLVCRS